MVQDQDLQRYINRGLKELRKSEKCVILHLSSDRLINGDNWFTMKWDKNKGKWIGEHRYSTWESTYPSEEHGPYFHELDASDERFILSAYGIKEKIFYPGSVLKLSPSLLEKIALEQPEKD